MSNGATIELSSIYNDYTINIFSDASSKPGQIAGLFCYGSIVVNKDTIIDSFYTFHDKCKCSYDAELLGLRASLYAALNYKRRFYNQIKQINIFSDNRAVITCINGANKLKCKYVKGDYVSINASKSVPYLEPIVNECASILNELRSLDPYTVVNLFHQNGHVLDKYSQVDGRIDDAWINFNYYNGLSGDVSKDFIIYISKYNRYIDECTGIYMMDYVLSKDNSRFKVTTVPIKFKHKDTPKKYYTNEEVTLHLCCADT